MDGAGVLVVLLLALLCWVDEFPLELWCVSVYREEGRRGVVYREEAQRGCGLQGGGSEGVWSTGRRVWCAGRRLRLNQSNLFLVLVCIDELGQRGGEFPNEVMAAI